ncbi:rRNA biogenesis protein rrp36 [Neophaeococcomyces mojaviensis]|uniref:rRNA biogenesis protein rrp36 n=1 Tax=Neophaeococcomyces mojaviensis TaxID=3383035 RepID=A0ACC3AJ29_9EURO|nr:rRNA biogenesis protein rrp36 [Knufia sp. JES_112]
MSRAIRPRDESDTDEEPSDLNTSGDEGTKSSDEEVTEDDIDDAGSQASVQSGGLNEEGDVKDISFGALAEAQARFKPNPRKRKLLDREDQVDDKSDRNPYAGRSIDDRKRQHEQPSSRSSKHAPTIMSTRNPVTRKRAIFSPPPALKYRDPRFDAAVVADGRHGNTSSSQVADRNYAFLSEYQAAEILDLKSQIRRSKDPGQQVELKRQVMSIEAKLRNAELRKREAEILREHKQKEKQAIKEGKKARPYYLKPSDVKSQIQQERQTAMGKRARDKSEKRKKKREKTKESRDMPRVRRTFVQND